LWARWRRRSRSVESRWRIAARQRIRMPAGNPTDPSSHLLMPSCFVLDDLRERMRRNGNPGATTRGP
jgi:hypothetical protein